MLAIEQWERLKLMATERKLDADDRNPYSIRIGSQRYSHHIYASCALLRAFARLNILVPPELLARPDDMD